MASCDLRRALAHERPLLRRTAGELGQRAAHRIEALGVEDESVAARVEQLGRSVAFVSGRLIDPDGEVLAAATATFKMRERRD